MLIKKNNITTKVEPIGELEFPHTVVFIIIHHIDVIMPPPHTHTLNTIFFMYR